MQRDEFLNREPVALGASWARTICDRTRGEGRLVDGGWPGTVVEARAMVSMRLNQVLAGKTMAQLSQTELSAATTATYAQAKKDWLQAVHATKRSNPRRAEAER